MLYFLLGLNMFLLVMYRLMKCDMMCSVLFRVVKLWCRLLVVSWYCWVSVVYESWYWRVWVVMFLFDYYQCGCVIFSFSVKYSGMLCVMVFFSCGLRLMVNLVLSMVVLFLVVDSIFFLGLMLLVCVSISMLVRMMVKRVFKVWLVFLCMCLSRFLQQGVIEVILFGVGGQLQFGFFVDVYVYGIGMMFNEGGDLFVVFLWKD